MFGLLELVGFPPHPIGVVCILLVASFWGLRARLKNRPYLLALQAAVVAGFFARLAIAVQNGVLSFTAMLSDILTLTIGQFVMCWFFCWLIISLIFIIRKRNDSTNIFTRNRNK